MKDRFITSFILQFKRFLINPLVPVSSVNLQNYMQSKNVLSVNNGYFKNIQNYIDFMKCNSALQKCQLRQRENPFDSRERHYTCK